MADQGDALQGEPSASKQVPESTLGSGLAIGISIALFAMLLSTESEAMARVLHMKFWPVRWDIYRPLDASLTAEDHLAGGLRLMIVLGGAYCAGKLSARIAGGERWLAGFIILVACLIVRVGYEQVLHPAPDFYAALSALLFPFALFGGIWMARKESKFQANGLLAQSGNDTAGDRPWSAVLTGVFITWFLPLLIRDGYLRVMKHDVDIYPGAIYSSPQLTSWLLHWHTLGILSALLGGYLCARVAKRQIALATLGLMFVLVAGLIRMATDPMAKALVDSEGLRLALVFLGLFAGWLHNRRRLRGHSATA